jgi:hypothetical protein
VPRRRVVNIVAVKDHARARDGLQIHLLVRPGSIFSSRPCRSCRHGAQGRVKAGRRTTPRRELDVSRPRPDRPSTVLPLREAVAILGMGLHCQQTAQFAIHRWGGWRDAEPWQRAPRQLG